MTTYKKGSSRPLGYYEFFEWADAQQKAGLRQTQCIECHLFQFPQEYPCTHKYPPPYQHLEPSRRNNA